MRIKHAIILAGMTLASFPALAGTLSVTNGQTTWQSTKCTEPVEPQSLLNANRESMANHMNSLVTQYNDYAQAMQSYMDCVSNEAQSDASATNDAITHSAQATLDAAKTKVNSLNSTMQISKSASSTEKRPQPKIDIQ